MFMYTPVIYYYIHQLYTIISKFIYPVAV